MLFASNKWTQIRNHVLSCCHFPERTAKTCHWFPGPWHYFIYLSSCTIYKKKTKHPFHYWSISCSCLFHDKFALTLCWCWNSGVLNFILSLVNNVATPVFHREQRLEIFLIWSFHLLCLNMGFSSDSGWANRW